MKIISATTQLPKVPFSRAHCPTATDYVQFRPCLRWDFGFTCPFCLVHESDLIEHGVEGKAQTTVEHHNLKSKHPTQRNSYDNCLYSCRYCNIGRGKRPALSKDGRRLLDPTSVSWSSRFEQDDFEIKPNAADRDAEYTASVYKINDSTRKTMRKNRHKVFGKYSQLLALGPRLQEFEEIVKKASDPQDVLQAQQILSDIRKTIPAAMEYFARYKLIPLDAPTRCRCNPPVSFQLPAEVERQAIEVS